MEKNYLWVCIIKTGTKVVHLLEFTYMYPMKGG